MRLSHQTIHPGVFALTTESANSIMITALEQHGLVNHVDVDSEYLQCMNSFTIDISQIHKVKDGYALIKPSKDLHSHRIYFAIDSADDDSVNNVVLEANRNTIAIANLNSKLKGALTDAAEILSLSENTVVLMLRYLKRRAAFFKANTMLSQLQLAEAMEIKDKNISRATKKLVAEHQVIYLEKGGNLVFPAFQFTERGQVYPELLNAIPILIEHEISYEDLCFWLTEKTSTTLYVPDDDCSYFEISFEDMMESATKASNGNIVYNGKPIDTLIKGDMNIFNALFDSWISPESYNALFDLHNVCQNQ
jgi:hypothetical protein